jgi:hypothetical protein
MYGLEYSAMADMYSKDGKKLESDFVKSMNKNSPATDQRNTTITSNQNLLRKLHALKECPDYLLPRFFLSTGTGSSVLSPSLPKGKKKTSVLTPVYYTDDFILLSEFSEIEGPKPLLTIPTDGGTGFNKNEYSLHLMCVDFHSHLQPHKLIEANLAFDSIDHPDNDDPPTSTSLSSSSATTTTKSSSYSKFTLTKDTSIVNYYDINSNVTACVHHFTLYDLTARGFVRPFCLAYISYEKSKSIRFFEQIRLKFTQITSLLKSSNFDLFQQELTQRCSDLRFTRDLFSKWSADDNDVNDNNKRLKLTKDFKIDNETVAKLNAASSNEKIKALQLNAIDSLFNEMENVLQVVLNELKANNWPITKKS